ncbi:hypothetical protein ACH4S9_04200 [Streptomyces sp. NPDC021225]|uniref:hypothetical protein n=1 Tax=Streptomyces sp. NPDC021225 TaxID=3365121 RepID=UPI0037AAC512
MFELGDLTVRYPRDGAPGGADDTGGADGTGAVIGLETFPTALTDRLAAPRNGLPEDSARHDGGAAAAGAACDRGEAPGYGKGRGGEKPAAGARGPRPGARAPGPRAGAAPGPGGPAAGAR